MRGHSLARICEGLNTRGIPSPGGGKWYSSTLIGTASRGTGILRNQVYKGVIQFNKAEWKSHPLTGERLAVTRLEDEWITVDAPHLAIIPIDLFDRVQREMISRSSVRKAVVEERLRPSDEKRQAEENARIQRWRSRQVTRLTNAMLFFSGKLHCGWSGKKLTALRKGMYSCKEPNCPVCTVYTDDIQPRALQALRTLSPQDILTGYQSPELEAKRESLRARIAAADADTTKRRKEIAAVLDTLSDQTRRVEIKPSLENKATELRQITMRRSVTVRNLLFYSPWPLSRTPWTTGRTIWSALRQPPGNRLEALKGNRERHSTESGSMTRGGSASAGVRATPKTWKSWTITKARRHPMLAPTPPVHPGEILREEFMQPLGLTAYAVAQACHVPRTRIERLFRLETPVTADTTLRLGRAFGTGPEFWMNLQALYDLGSTMPDDLDQVRPLVAAK